jgi:hypothetical protein
MTQAETTRRYQAVCKRSLARHLDLFLTTCFLRSPQQELSQTGPEVYQTFQPTQQEWTFYLRSQQAKSYGASIDNIRIGELDKAIKEWWKSIGTPLKEYEEIHQQFHYISANEFQALFTAEPACAYCHVTEAQFQTLISAGQVQTKRLRTRGHTLEIDCKIPQLGYADGNVVLCCYWCNNAKTDEFSMREFQPIADALEQVWRRRLTLISY